VTVAAETRLQQFLSRGPPTGAWFLHGDADRLRDEAARMLADAALDPSTRDFNYDEYRSEDVSAEELAATLAMPPLMAERRVIVLREVQKLSPAIRKVLVGALGTLPGDVVLILTGTIPKGSRASFYRELGKRCRTLDWSAPRDAEIPGWIVERGRGRWGLELGPEAAQALAAAVGGDPSRLDAELEKLSAAGDRRPTADRVRELVPRTRRIDRWTWLDLVAERKYGAALRELDDLLTSESGVGLVAGLVDQHLLVGVAVEGGVARVKQTLSETGRGYLSWKANSYARQARAWRPGEIDGALERLYRADRLLKSGGKDRAVLAELLLVLEGERRARA